MPAADSIECPHCTARIRIKSEAILGKKVNCPKCSEPFVAKAVAAGSTKPAKTATKSATRPEADSAELVAVSCPHCDAKFRLKSVALGKKRSCPKCAEEFIPRAMSSSTTATKSRTSKAKKAEAEPNDDDDFLKSLSAAARDSQSAEAEEEPDEDESEELAPRKSKTSSGKRKKTSSSSSGGGFSMSGLLGWVIGGTIGGTIGAAIWVAVGYFTGFEVGWIAWGVGVLTGMGVAAVASANGEADNASGVTAAVISILSVLAGKYAVVHLVIDQALNQIPAGDPQAQQMQQMQQGLKQAVFLDSFGPIDILWFFLAAGSAYKLGSGQQESD